jgi:hypothetical protein
VSAGASVEPPKCRSENESIAGEIGPAAGFTATPSDLLRWWRKSFGTEQKPCKAVRRQSYCERDEMGEAVRTRSTLRKTHPWLAHPRLGGRGGGSSALAL